MFLKCYALQQLFQQVPLPKSHSSLKICHHPTHPIMINSHITISGPNINPLLPSAMLLIIFNSVKYVISFEEIRVGAS